MARKDTNTIQTYIAVTQNDDGSIQLGTKERPVSATTGASFDATGLDAAAVTALIMALVGAFDEMTRLYLEHTDHNGDIRTWKGTCWAAGKYLANHGDCRVGTWGAGLSAAIAALTNHATGKQSLPVYRITEALREHKAQDVDWAALFDGMGRTAIPGIVGPTYTQIHVKGAGKDSGFKPSVKQGYESGDLNPDSVGYFICG